MPVLQLGIALHVNTEKKIAEQQLSLSYVHSVLTNWSSTPWKKKPKTVYWNSPVQIPNCFTWVKTGSNHFSHLRLHKKYVDLFLFFYSCLANLCLADLMSLLAWVPSRSSLMQISISFLFFFFGKRNNTFKKNKAIACFCKSMLQRNDSAKKVLLEKQQLPHTSPRQWICA